MRHTPCVSVRSAEGRPISNCFLTLNYQFSTLVTVFVTVRMLDYLQGVYEEHRCLFEMFYSTVRRSRMFCQRVELVRFYVRQNENVILNRFNYFSILY